MCRLYVNVDYVKYAGAYVHCNGVAVVRRFSYPQQEVRCLTWGGRVVLSIPTEPVELEERETAFGDIILYLPNEERLVIAANPGSNGVVRQGIQDIPFGEEYDKLVLPYHTSRFYPKQVWTERGDADGDRD